MQKKVSLGQTSRMPLPDEESNCCFCKNIVHAYIHCMLLYYLWHFITKHFYEIYYSSRCRVSSGKLNQNNVLFTLNIVYFHWVYVIKTIPFHSQMCAINSYLWQPPLLWEDWGPLGTVTPYCTIIPPGYRETAELPSWPRPRRLHQKTRKIITGTCF